MSFMEDYEFILKPFGFFGFPIFMICLGVWEMFQYVK